MEYAYLKRDKQQHMSIFKQYPHHGGTQTLASYRNEE